MFKFRSLLLAAAVMMCSGVNTFAQTDTSAVLELEEIVVSARVADINTTSLRITDINSDQLKINAPGRTFPELIRNVPGVYSTSESGSFGDAKINIRGFKQENISVLLNGIPISGLTSGSMFWNNWMGLADATASIQVQKGIGNSMISDNSVGGTINIITTRPDSQPSLEFGAHHTGYGTNSVFVKLNTGNLGKGWAISMMGSHNWGSSYVDCTGLDTWSYMLAVTKKINSSHSLNFTALGSPETHEQRSVRLSYEEVEKYGRNYNKNWGWYTMADGSKEKRTISRNNYFKPYFTLSHSYDGRNDEQLGFRLYNTVYAAFANGGGYYTESTGRRIASFMVPEGQESEGQIDWDAVQAYNLAVSPDEHGRRAQNIMSDYLAGHTQFGVKSNVVADFTENFQLDAGLHYQLYDTWEREMITDLLGADYWYEDYGTKSLMGLSGRNPIKKVGDFVRTDNGRNQHYLTLYAIGSLTLGEERPVVLILGTSLSGTMLRRWDLYNYSEEDKWSNWAKRAGASVKMGALYNLSQSVKLYANAAYYTRAPYANVFFSNGNNSISRDIVNEKNYLSEIGVRKIGRKYGAEATVYVAYWKDKTLLSAPYKSIDEDPFKYMVKGLDALHYGLEIDMFYKPVKYVRIDAYASLGDWRWKNDVSTTLYNPDTMRPEGEIKVYADGLHVGDAPQTQIGASVELTLPKGISIQADWNFNDRLWADFDPVSRTSAENRVDSYRIPAYHLLNMGAAWNTKLFDRDFTLFVNLANVTDCSYILRSKDGVNHDKESFTGYWGNGRSVNFGLRFKI